VYNRAPLLAGPWIFSFNRTQSDEQTKAKYQALLARKQRLAAGVLLAAMQTGDWVKADVKKDQEGKNEL